MPLADSVTPIDTATGRPGRPLPAGYVFPPTTVGAFPTAVAITA
jgi:hypothetical protein